MKRMVMRGVGEVTVALLLLIILDFLPVGFRVLIPVLVVMYLATVWIPVRHRIMLFSSTLLGLVVINLALPPFMSHTYYRPHDKLKKEQMRGFKRYAPNQDVLVENGHGDLVAVGFAHSEVSKIQENRKLHFITDRFGYRNEPNAAGPFSAIFAGDSFIAGNGNDQADTLSEVMRSSGYNIYNLGHNGDIGEYISALRYARDVSGIVAPGFLFAYEGNDFYGVNYCVQASSPIGGVRDLHRAMKELHLSRFLTAIWGRLTASSLPPAIAVERKGSESLGFLLEYKEAVTQKDYNGECLRNLLLGSKDVVSAIFFIPEKSRVYEFGVSGQSVYSKFLAGVAKEMGVPFVDLSERLKKEAQLALKGGKYVYWRDDTHWNRAGMMAVAPLVQGLLK